MSIRSLISRLIEPQVIVSVTGVKHEVEPLVKQVTSLLISYPSQTRSGCPGPKPPCYTAALDWLVCFKRDLATWVGGRVDSIDSALNVLSQLNVGEHQLLVENMLNKYIITGEYIAYPPIFTIRGACPKCGATSGVTPDGKPSDAIYVNEIGGHCCSCGAMWDGTNVVSLSRSLLH